MGKKRIKMPKCTFCSKHIYEYEGNKVRNINNYFIDEEYYYYCKKNCYSKSTNFSSVSHPKFKINDFVKLKGYKLYGFVIEVVSEQEKVRQLMAERGFAHTTKNIPYDKKKYTDDHVHNLTPFYRLHINIVEDKNRWQLTAYESFMKTKEGYCNQNNICFVKEVVK
jgi:hypothetical protein